MDCPSEESLVRTALGDAPAVRGLAFDLPRRTLVVWHAGEPAEVLARLEPLGLGARAKESREAGEAELPSPTSDTAAEARTLWTVLAINAVMFVVEVVAGWRAESTGLLADGLDMLADALVYGLALHAVGRSAARKRRAARVAGLLQLLLALGVFGEVTRRALAGSAPEPPAMIGVSLLALAANVLCLVLVHRHRHRGAHMEASAIFSANDVLANLGVMAAGALVAATGSALPDLVIGLGIAALVLRGAVRILRLR
jgi:cation diffusion facilitator family transporter